MVVAAYLTAIVGAIMLVRLGWSGRRGSAVAGWTLAAVALAGLTLGDGAWGLSVGVVVGSLTALLFVLHAAWRAPVKPARASSAARATDGIRAVPSIGLPRRAADIARRFGVFVAVVPAAFAAAQWLAFGAQAAARRAGAVDADAIVLTLFLQPLLWGVIMAVQMTRQRPSAMIAAPATAALLGTLLWTAA